MGKRPLSVAQTGWQRRWHLWLPSSSQGWEAGPSRHSIWKSAHQMCHSSHPALVCLVNGTQGRGDKGQLLSVPYKCDAGAGGFWGLPCFPSNFECACALTTLLPCYCHAAFPWRWLSPVRPPATQAFVGGEGTGWCSLERTWAERVVGKKIKSVQCVLW